MKIHYFLVFVLSLNFVQIVNASGSKAGKPPKESVDACAKKSLEDKCHFVGKDGDKIGGHCKKAGDSSILYCFGDMPPKEVVDACKGKAANDSCEFVGKDGSKLAGVCVKHDNAPALLCKTN